MQSKLQSRFREVSPAAAKLLCKRRTIEVLDTISAKPRPVSEIAEAISDGLERTWRYVHKLERAGIVEVHSKRARAGRSQKLFTPKSFEYIVSYADRHRTVSQELSQTLMESIERNDCALAERFFFDGTQWRVGKIYEEDAPSETKQHEQWMFARLNAKQRDALRVDIAKVFMKYDAAQSSGSRQYLVRFACTIFDQR